MKEQFVEGKLEGCKKDSCEETCCDNNNVEEWTNEYFAFHERMKDHLLSQGIKIEFCGDRVRFKNCSDGKRCKFKEQGFYIARNCHRKRVPRTERQKAN